MSKVEHISEIFNKKLVWKKEEGFPRQLKFLVVSDTHMKTENMEKLQQHYSEFLLQGGEKPSQEYKEKKEMAMKEGPQIPNFDYVIHSGDFQNLTEEETTSPETVAKSMGNITTCLNFLEQFNSPVLYVPGNHDPQSLMNNKSPEEHPILSDRSLNLHHRVIKLDQGLYIAGIGGSCPAYEILEDQSAKEIWEPVPWKKETDLYTHLKGLINHVENELVKGSSLNKEGEDNSVLILLTHMGPRSSSSTVILDKAAKLAKRVNSLEQGYLASTDKMPGTILSGSTALDKIIMEGSHVPIFLNIHGHTHIRSTNKMTPDTTIVGPGSLGYDGDWCEITLEKEDEHLAWKIKRVEFLNK